jgi:predicted RNA-binding protein with PIN domain
MEAQVLIDGNNLLFAVRNHAPLPSVGRETMVRIIDRWARQTDSAVTIVFDGPPPREGLAQQLATGCVHVRFSSPQSADDVIIALLKSIRDPSKVRVVTGDTAIRHEARRRRCDHTDAVRFVAELFASGGSARAPHPGHGEKRGEPASDPSDPRHECRGSGGERRGSGTTRSGTRGEKPGELDPDESNDWLKWFGVDERDSDDEFGGRFP